MKKLNAYNIFPKKLFLAFFFGVVLILVASSLVVMVGVVQLSSVDYSIASNKSLPIVTSGSPFTSGTIITLQYARSIYTSSVPETIADGINNLLGNSSAKAYPMTVSLANVNDSAPIIVRGLPIAIIQKSIPISVSGQIGSSSGNWTLLGSLAAKELDAHVGSILSLTYPLSGTNSSFKVVVKGIYSLGNEADYESLVPLPFGQELNGLSNGVVNAIVAPRSNLDGQNVESLIRSNYLVKLDYSGVPGAIDVVDSSGYVHNTLDAVSNSSFVQQEYNFSLPFGSYNIVLDQNGIRTELAQFTPNSNSSTIQVSSSNVSRTGSAQSFLYVKNDSSSLLHETPILVSSPQNQTIAPQSYNQTLGYWTFAVQEGLYTLVLGNGKNITNFLIMGNSTFDPASNFSNLDSNLKISISAPSGFGSAFSITVKDTQSSQVIFSRSTTTTALSIPVQSNHTYTISVVSSSTDLLLQETVSMSKQTEVASFTFPSVSFNSGSVPISDYSVLGIGTPTKSGSFDFLIGGALTSTIALFAIIFALLSLAMITLSKQLMLSLRKETKALSFLFPTRASIRLKVKLPFFVLLIGAMLGGILISFGAFFFFGFSSSLTFLGYGIESYPILFIFPVAFALVLVSYIRISTLTDSGIFGSFSSRD